MRFSEGVAILAAVAAVPVAVALSGPSMSEDQFLAEVRCVAYQDVVQANAPLGSQKTLLNAEATRQPDAVVTQALREVAAISRLGAGDREQSFAERLAEGGVEACARSQRFANASHARSG